jgi:hypothetical protein
MVFILHEKGISWGDIQKFDGFFYSAARHDLFSNSNNCYKKKAELGAEKNKDKK